MRRAEFVDREPVDNVAKSEKFDIDKFFTLSLDLLCIADVDGTFKKINPAFVKTLGFSQSELLSKSFFELIHPDDQASTLLEIEKLAAGKITINFENRFRTADGSYRVLNWSASPDLATGNLYASARDVTEQRRAEARIKQNYNALSESAIVAQTDAKGTITEVNEKFCQLSGYSKEELIGKNHRILNSGAHPKEFFANMWRTISGGQVWHGLIENRKKTGESYFVQSVISPIFGIENTLEGYLAIGFDMTKQKQAELKLASTTELLERTSQMAKIGGWELDLKTFDVYFSKQTALIHEVDYPYAPVNFSDGSEWYPPEAWPTVQSAVKAAIEHGIPYDLESPFITAKERKIWVRVQGYPVIKDGKIAKVEGTIQDITARKLAEMNLLRTAKLASLGELSAGIAHEINNPLAIIDGAIGNLKKYLHDPEKLNSKIESIKKSVLRISKIVNGLRKFSGAGEKSVYSHQSIDNLMQDVFSLVEVKSKRENVEVTLDLTKDAFIFCNTIDIEQVLVNLISNAIDAVKKLPEKWVKVSTFDDGMAVVLQVEDSGPGIPESVREKIFEPFFTTKSTGEGTGLGLSITKGILDEHRASIAVLADRPNTCFEIRFPKVPDAKAV